MGRPLPAVCLFIVLATATACAQSETPIIQDNSFLVEEAYNQEFGVVQHIQTFLRTSGNSWLYSFTQEWPVDPAPRHQLSYTLTAGRNGDFPGRGAGWGDLALNYRYQLVGNGEARLAISPRATFLAPTGQSRFGRGAGGAGFQFLLPVSYVLGPLLTTHFNAGTTLVPARKNEFGQKAFSRSFNLGQSFVFTPSRRVNFLLETIYINDDAVIAPGRTRRDHSVLMSPGIRWAYNLKSGMQIVPGIAVPLGVGPSAGQRGIFFYFSVEHPYRNTKR